MWHVLYFFLNHVQTFWNSTKYSLGLGHYFLKKLAKSWYCPYGVGGHYVILAPMNFLQNLAFFLLTGRSCIFGLVLVYKNWNRLFCPINTANYCHFDPKLANLVNFSVQKSCNFSCVRKCHWVTLTHLNFEAKLIQIITKLSVKVIIGLLGWFKLFEGMYMHTRMYSAWIHACLHVCTLHTTQP